MDSNLQVADYWGVKLLERRKKLGHEWTRINTKAKNLGRKYTQMGRQGTRPHFLM